MPHFWMGFTEGVKFNTEHLENLGGVHFYTTPIKLEQGICVDMVAEVTVEAYLK